MAAVYNPNDAKSQALCATGALNPDAAHVSDATFVAYPFFDACDLVQVKYEIVRGVEAEGQSVTRTAATFGFSQPALYAAQATLARDGPPALMRPTTRSSATPQAPPEIVTVLRQARADQPILLSSELAERVHAQFGVRVHRRTIEPVLGPRPERPMGAPPVTRHRHRPHSGCPSIQSRSPRIMRLRALALSAVAV